MASIDSLLLSLTERACHKVQVLTGTTNVWLALQLTNLSIIGYFVWAATYSWMSPAAVRIPIGLFCGSLFYVLTQTVFKEPIEAYENNAYRRVSKGYRNPRRLRDAPLRIAFLTLSCVLWYPILFAYVNLRVRVAFLSYFLVVLTTVVLYLLACDPLPPCAGTLRIREWFRRSARSRLAEAPSAHPRASRSRPNGSPFSASVWSAQTQRPSRRTHVDESAASIVTGSPSTVHSSCTS